MGNLKKLTLLHSNDMHGDFLAEQIDEQLIGGVSMLSGYVSKIREQKKNTLYCVAGDMFRGSVIDSEFKGISTVEIMNLLSPDVVTLGNHETDYGIGHLLFIEKCAKFPIINANFYIRHNRRRLFKPCLVKKIGGMKILFIGILTEQVLNETKKDNTIGTMVDVTDAAKEVERICNSYRSEDIDLTVLLTHIGFEEDKKLAAQLNPALGVDVIIGGHSHTLLDEPVVVNDIIIAQAGVGTNQIGQFDFLIDTDLNRVASYEWKCVNICEENCPVDEGMDKLLNSYKEVTDAKFNRVITRFKKELTHPRRNEETSLGNLCADILKDSLGVDIMMLGSGGIRVNSLGPSVTYGDFTASFPYDDNIMQLSVTGAQFKQMMLFMLRDEQWTEHCEFYQISKGVEIEYIKNEKQFSKFNFMGKPVSDDQILTLGIEKFHFINLEEHTSVSEEEVEMNAKARVISTSCNQIYEEYLSENQLMDADVEGRIKVI